MKMKISHENVHCTDPVEYRYNAKANNNKTSF